MRHQQCVAVAFVSLLANQSIYWLEHLEFWFESHAKHSLLVGFDTTNWQLFHYFCSYKAHLGAQNSHVFFRIGQYPKTNKVKYIN